MVLMTLLMLGGGSFTAGAADDSQQLAEALKYYYDANYDKALPLFRQIAERNETMDLMFWVGTSAANLGQNELAMEKFKAMLAQNPNLNRVRLELADVYIKANQFDLAKKELETVRATNPPPAVIQNIDRRLAMIQRAGEKLSMNLVFTQGYQWDDNASSGPDTKQLDVTGGTLTLSSTQTELESSNWLTKLGGSLRYDLGAPQAWIWATGVNLFSSVNMDYSEFNFRLMDLTTGPWWVGKTDIVKLPVGYTDTNYGSDPLSKIVHIDPSIEHFFSKTVSVQAAYTYAEEDYNEGKVAGSDNKLNQVTIGPNFYLGDRKHVISATYRYEDRDADLDRNSYKADILTCSYFTKFPTNTELFVFYRWFKRKYEDNPPLYADNREDKRNTVSATVSQRFMKYYFASLGYTYMDNRSNAGLYSFDKNMITFNVGVNF
ncbi:MAG: DUF560 domain-containing protein [Desulfobacterales bacterium]|nr:DUF560 domain-containing protein [Desulfobacterales bacterium]